VTRVTLDSNVYLSGFVFGGKPKRVLEMAIDGEIEVAVSDPIIQEVRRHLLGKFGWSEPRAAEAVESITEFAKHVTPTEAIDTVPTDPDDNRVLECAVSAGSQTIVTGDDDLLRLVAFRGIEIVRVADFLTRFSAGDR
jgi:putative PIN family toxin of toxin-antitoxin system